MKVLVIGSGGREHALAWKLSQSPKVTQVFVAPGNPGTETFAENVKIEATDLLGLMDFALDEEIDLTVVGPEQPLTAGIVDTFEDADLLIFGPNRKAARLEGSKAFMKEILVKYNIPTADYAEFTVADEAKTYLQNRSCKEGGYPVVIKADGLAAGKGVIIAENIGDALVAIEEIMEDKKFGTSGDKIIIEEFLTGEEASFIALTDGKKILSFPSSQDHKAIFDGDKGPNTGGMGAYSPAPVLTKEIENEVIEDIIKPLVKGLEAEGSPYKGILYAGLMIDKGKVKVLEFNCRFGDPECQPLLMRLEDDLFDILMEIAVGEIKKETLNISEDATVCVVMASKGYPETSSKGDIITGIEEAEKAGVKVFHSGTKKENNNIVTNGGRVLGITAKATSIKEAIDKAYEGVSKITFDGMQIRTDIGKKALNR